MPRWKMTGIGVGMDLAAISILAAERTKGGADEGVAMVDALRETIGVGSPMVIWIRRTTKEEPTSEPG